MNLSTKYLGLDLAHPFMPGASPMVDDLDTVKRLEDAGASAIVMHSLFEEQIRELEIAAHTYVDFIDALSPEADMGFLPDSDAYALGPHAYLDQVRKVKEAVGVPVIASLNGTTRSGWLEYGHMIEQAGADALELNVFAVEADPDDSAASVEARTAAIVADLTARVKIPCAVKLSPFYTSLSHFAKQLAAAGAKGLILFNRAFSPDIDVEALEVKRQLHLSDSSELPLRLRWLGILSAQLDIPLAVSGGVHRATDAIQALMTGASAVQLVSALLTKGPHYLATLRAEVERWMIEHEYESLAAMRGNMNLARCPNPSAYARANYIHLLQNWRPSAASRG